MPLTTRLRRKLERKPAPFLIPSPPGPRGPRRLWIWIGMAGLVLVLAILATSLIVYSRLGPWARNYLVHRLEERYNAHVQLEDLQISLYPRIVATGSGL